jgi:uncharacterized protein
MQLPPSNFHVMVKPRGAICNLACEYCFFLAKENLFPNSSFRMSDEILEAYTRQYIESQRGPEVTFAWQGGEPTLMGVDFFRKAVALQQRYRKSGTTIQNSFQTNGILLNDEWATFFKEHNFLIGISLDGPAQYHDRYRVDKGGQPTHDRVMVGIRKLQDHHVEYNILACVNDVNADHPLEVYRFFRDEVKAQFIQFIPIVERDNETGYQEGNRVTSRSVSGKKYGQFLTTIFDEWVRRDVGSIYVQIFDVCLGVWYNRHSGLCVFDETCGYAMALEHTGDLYACDHFVEPSYHLGNILEQPLASLAASEEQQRFGSEKKSKLPRYCQKCEVRFMCNGGCPKDRILKTPDGQPGLNYLCEGFKHFFTHIDEPMKMMATLLHMERTPAEIMNLLAEEASPPESSAALPEQHTSRRRRGKR